MIHGCSITAEWEVRNLKSFDTGATPIIIFLVNKIRFPLQPQNLDLLHLNNNYCLQVPHQTSVYLRTNVILLYHAMLSEVLKCIIPGRMLGYLCLQVYPSLAISQTLCGVIHLQTCQIFPRTDFLLLLIFLIVFILSIISFCFLVR